MWSLITFQKGNPISACWWVDGKGGSDHCSFRKWFYHVWVFFLPLACITWVSPASPQSHGREAPPALGSLLSSWACSFLCLNFAALNGFFRGSLEEAKQGFLYESWQVIPVCFGGSPKIAKENYQRLSFLVSILFACSGKIPSALGWHRLTGMAYWKGSAATSWGGGGPSEASGLEDGSPALSLFSPRGLTHAQCILVAVNAGASQLAHVRTGWMKCHRAWVTSSFSL